MTTQVLIQSVWFFYKNKPGSLEKIKVSGLLLFL